MSKLTIQQHLSKKVARGAKLLDRKTKGWERKVKLTKLEMDSSCNCVIGQLFNSDYCNGMTDLGLRNKYGRPKDQDYGFDVSREEENWDKEMVILQKLWEEEIRKRRVK